MATTNTSGEGTRSTTDCGTDNIGAGSRLPASDPPAGETQGPAGDGNAPDARTGRKTPTESVAQRSTP